MDIFFGRKCGALRNHAALARHRARSGVVVESARIPQARAGRIIGFPFLLLGAALFAGGVGWFECRLWGFRLVVALIAAQVAGI
jgi:hypothetical protein